MTTSWLDSIRSIRHDLSDAESRSRVRHQLPNVIAVTLWALGSFLVSRADAGLAGYVVLWGILSALPLYVVGRGWRLPWWLHLGAAALPVSVFIVAIATNDGWYGASRAARYGYGAVLLLAVVAWATTPRRRIVIASIASLVVLDQYTTAWFPWWGSGNPSHLMFGTFYWHNQFAAYCVAGAAFAVMLAILGRRVIALIGVVVLIFATTGALASGSRMGLIFLGVVFLAAAVVSAITRGRRGLARWAALVLASAATSVFMSSRLFFARSSWPWETVAGRSANGSFESSGVSRLEFWRVGLLMGRDHPLTGGGLLNFGPLSACYARTSYSSNTHNEWVLAWAEGGAVALVPMLAVLVGVIWLLVRSLRPLPRASTLLADPGRWGGLLAVLLLLAHVGVDFDWSYPALVGMAGIAGGVALAPLLNQSWIAREARAGRWRAVAAVTLLVCLLAASVAGRTLDPLPHDPLTPLPVAATTGCVAP